MAYDRSKGRLHEKDHSHRHETDFRVTARRNKLLGLWAAELMNIRGAEADAYAKQFSVPIWMSPATKTCCASFSAISSAMVYPCRGKMCARRWTNFLPKLATSWRRAEEEH